MKDIKSLLLILMSAGLVGTWIYHIYDKSVYSNMMAEVSLKDSVKTTNAIRDSLTSFYTATIRELDFQLDSSRNKADSIQWRLEKILEETRKLKNEINGILQNKDATLSDLNLARSKIEELQQKVNEMKEQNTNMEEEKTRLTGKLDQLNEELKSHELNMKRLSLENKNLADKINIASAFLVSDIRFRAMNVKGNKEVETKVAARSDKFVISFNVQNNIVDYTNAELVIVLNDPDGQVIQNPVWDSGKFNSLNDGSIGFTRKLKFDYKKGEQQNVIFSIETDQYAKGTYKLLVYHNGVMIAKATQTLK